MLVASLLPALANSRYATMQNEPTDMLPVLIVRILADLLRLLAD